MASSPSPAPAASAESSDAFEQRIMNTVTSGFLLPCIALGSKLGLFDKMAEFTQPVTSQELADAMDYKERYVREWLNSMVCLRVFDYDVPAGKYFFPSSRQPLFVSGGSKYNPNLVGLPDLMRGYPKLVECFPKDGPRGVAIECLAGFREWAEADAKEQCSTEHFRDVFGQEPQLLEKLESGIKVCDVGCNTGIQAQFLAEMFPNSSFHGCDISADAIQRAKQLTSSAADQSNNNLSFSVQDVCNLPADWSESFDFVVTFDVIHDLPYASKALKQICNCLKPGGWFYMRDIKNGNNPVDNDGTVYSYSLFSCLPQSLYHEGSDGLGATWTTDTAVNMLEAAGFSSVKELKDTSVLPLHMMCSK